MTVPDIFLPATSPIIWLHPSHCIRRAPRGAVKRILPRGPILIGYQVCCPACGFSGSYLAEESIFTEGPMVADTGPPEPCDEDSPVPVVPRPFLRPETLEMGKAVECFGCRGQLRITGGKITVERGA